VGDVCQLPPINQSVSPALSAAYFQENYHIEAEEAELTNIVRQQDGNDIVLSAERLRKLYFNPPAVKWGKFPFRGYKNIHLLPDQATLLAEYIQHIKRYGLNSATLICRSNRLCDTLTRLLRPALGLHSPLLQKGDLLLITQNNLISGLMNGDLVVVEEVSDVTESRARLTFRNVKVKELVTGKAYSQLLIEDVLNGTQTNLTSTQQNELFVDYYLRMKAKGVTQKNPYFHECMRHDVHLNALRAVYGFALTCHKAQGGEWSHVYLDIPKGMAFNPQTEVYQWLYTAMTRAKAELYLVDDFYVS
jgi:ATP-dependent exoDNAse (exonuclease V) alpha subunit